MITMNSRDGNTHMFDFCVSNPPYQEVRTSSRNPVVVNIFHLVQQNAFLFAGKTVMIYPGGRWMQGGGKGLSNFSRDLISDEHLVGVDYFTKEKTQGVFPGVGITDGVSIVRWDSGYSNDGVITLNGEELNIPDTGVLPLNASDAQLVSQIVSVCAEKQFGFIWERKQARTLFGVESDFVSKNPGSVERVNDGGTPPSRFVNPVKVLTNDKAGKAGRTTWFWMERADVPKGEEFIDRWQFAIKSAQFPHESGQMNNGVIISPGELFGRSKVSLGSFDTEEEVVNFRNLMTTELFQRLYHMTLSGGLSNLGAFVPDLGDYTDNNQYVKWDEPLDPQLGELFGVCGE